MGTDQIAVTGSGNRVTLDGGLSLNVQTGFTATLGTIITIVSNSTDQPVDGHFTGLPEGTSVNLAGWPFRISYGPATASFNVTLSVTQTPTASISGKVWFDGWTYGGVPWDMDGLQNTAWADTGYAVTVTLLDAAGAVVATTTSDGMYGNDSFAAVAPGQYRVRVSLPVVGGMAFAFSPEHQGSDAAIDSDVDADGLTDLFTLGVGDALDFDAGVYYTYNF